MLKSLKTYEQSRIKRPILWRGERISKKFSYGRITEFTSYCKWYNYVKRKRWEFTILLHECNHTKKARNFFFCMNIQYRYEHDIVVSSSAVRLIHEWYHRSEIVPGRITLKRNSALTHVSKLVKGLHILYTFQMLSFSISINATKD